MWNTATALAVKKKKGEPCIVDQPPMNGDGGKDIVVVCYHEGCYDGFMAYVIAEEALVAQNKCVLPWPLDPRRDIKADIARLRDIVKDMPVTQVLSFDVSMSESDAAALRCISANTHVFDHHKTTAAQWSSCDGLTLVMDKSGCELAWEHFHGTNSKEPFIVWAIAQRDMWTDAYTNNTRAVRDFTDGFYAKRAVAEPFLDMWLEELRNCADETSDRSYRFKNDGVLLGTVKAQRIDKMLTNAGDAMFAGKRARVLNACTDQSDVGDVMLARYADVDIAIVYWLNATTRQYHVSLRSRKSGPDVAVIAQEFLGGGHASAAGFKFAAGMPPPWQLTAFT